MKGWKILDNGAAEGERVDYETLIDLAAKLEVNEVIVPDSLGDRSRTMKLYTDFAYYTAQSSKFLYMGVCQGSTSAEFVDMAKAYSQSSWIHSIALPRLMTRISRAERYWVAEALWADDDVSNRFRRNVHCLGSGAWTREVVLLAECGLLRGIDTSMPFVMGMDKIRIKDTLAPYTVRQADYFNTVPTAKQKEIVLDNVRTFLEWAGHPTASIS